VSLVVAVYNQADLLPVVLGSIAAQEFPHPWELIFCDDGSTDDSPGIISRWCDEHPDIDVRRVWQPDRGFRLSRSRNNAIRCARGEVIVYSDADACVAPHFLDDHWRAHDLHPRAMVAGLLAAKKVDEAFLSNGRWNDLFSSIDGGARDWISSHARWIETDRPWMACTGGNLSVRRCSGIYFDEQFEGWGGEDRDYAYRLWQSGFKPVLLSPINSIQLRVRNRPANWHPIFGGKHEAVVQYLETRQRLRTKYPQGEMTPLLRQAGFCRLDPISNAWCYNEQWPGADPETVLEEYRLWSAR
jgi:GT2 family glycosyltransferase